MQRLSKKVIEPDTLRPCEGCGGEMAFAMQTFYDERLGGEFCSRQCAAYRFLTDIDLLSDRLWELYFENDVEERFHPENSLNFPDSIFSEKSTR